ncbi:sensor histidine kinase [Actinoalloteichus hymeniacidonis]|uniref:histidine kinase n=1 Tax=Actinoalloteichus hymeniacidonis TaxID=340345 RepID=A0AAC9HLN9_9PSEU|nr:sensor histidine kinase [Actinoalloteichus hymeniacidonis]AOS61466.1 signal transduction histidine kinase [Actinoalloteichus hymeniacidonis]MBB5910527.1 signal transduction histidine kinase [Actinoalloteichus hymeniacidonis]
MTTAAAPRVGRFPLLGWSFVFTVYSVLGIGLIVLMTVSTVLLVLTIGLPMVVAFAYSIRGYNNVYRLWAGHVLGRTVIRPYRPTPKGNLISRLRAIATDPATYRDYAWLWVNAILGFVISLVSLTLFAGGIFFFVLPGVMQNVPPGIFDMNLGFMQITRANSLFMWVFAALSFGLWWWLSPKLMTGYARLAAVMLGISERARLSQRVDALASSRAETVDTQAAELRRIERDLHDGAQARLVALGMSLGMAEEMLANNPAVAQELLTEARQSTSLALSELRDLVRGIHPPVLSDRGLTGGIQALAIGSPLQVEVDVVLPDRLPAPVESAAYFAVAEVLTNAAKHSGASEAWIRARHVRGSLNVLVGDDGRGGVVQEASGGLHGIERRLSAFDGTMHLSSPVGGPTIVSMQLPCLPE